MCYGNVLQLFADVGYEYSFSFRCLLRCSRILINFSSSALSFNFVAKLYGIVWRLVSLIITLRDK